MNVKKTKKFKENRPESYHVHDTLLQQTQQVQELEIQNPIPPVELIVQFSDLSTSLLIHKQTTRFRNLSTR